jgi:UDP-N-acetylglucosamine:LPS N-acetylglucosamine transferase
VSIIATDTGSGAATRVVILTADVGGGHRTVARALAEALYDLGGESGRTEVEVSMLDVYAAACCRYPLRAFPWLYHLASVHLPPWFLRMFVSLMNTRRGFTALERLVQPCNQPGLRHQFARLQPSIVVNVVPGWTNSARGALDQVGSSAPVVTVVTDLITVIRGWISDSAAAHVVATPEAVAQVARIGIPPSRVHCFGFPTPTVRTVPAATRVDQRERLGLDRHAPTALLMGGAEGSGQLARIACGLAETYPEAQIVVIAGRNGALRRRLAARLPSTRCTVLGHVENVADWMAASDLLLTKAGSATIMEAVHLGVPLLVTASLPQEAGTVRFLEERGIAEIAGDARTAATTAAQLLRDPERRARLAENGVAFRQPEAARDTAAFVLRTAAEVAA